jgi:hypothetical protein
VLEHERKALNEDGRGDLAANVEHVSVTQGDGLGFDVLSYSVDGRRKYIEVKTTSLPQDAPFFMTANEVQFSRANKDEYYLYRLYGYSQSHNRAYYYVIRGNVEESLDLVPVTYRACR